MSGRIGTIAVVGDGIAGWSTAAALKKRVPDVNVAVVPVPGMAPGLADVFGGTTPSIAEFHRDIGLDHRDVIVRTGAAIRLGTRYEDWGDAAPFSIGYGPVGVAMLGVPFAAAWTHLARTGDVARFAAFSPGASLGDAGKVGAGGDPLLDGYGHGVTLDMPVYRRFVEGYARHMGVSVTAAGLAAPTLSAGGIASLQLDDGSSLSAHLYVDATNADARLIGALDPAWEDWSGWLSADRYICGRGPVDDPLPTLDRAKKVEGGWRLEAALPGRTEQAVIYDDRLCDEADAAHMLRGEPVRFGSGRRPRAWIGNTVAIGEAQVVLEPLEGAPLHMLHTQIDRLVASLPDRDFAAIELDHYNRETNQEADRFRDVLIAHHLLAGDCRSAPPPLLAETLALFAERGRLPIRDGEGVSRDHWQALLIGHGVVPRRSDAVAAAVDRGQLASMMADYLRRLADLVARAPDHRSYLAALGARG